MNLKHKFNKLIGNRPAQVIFILFCSLQLAQCSHWKSDVYNLKAQDLDTVVHPIEKKDIKKAKEDEDLKFARIQFNYKHYNIAEFYIKKALMNDPENPFALRLLPWAYFFQGRYDLAMRSFQKSQSVFPKDPTTTVGLAWTHFALFQYDEALEAFNWAEKLRGDPFHIHKGRGLTNLKLVHVKEAKEDLSKIYTQEQIDELFEYWERWKGEKGDTLLHILPSMNQPSIMALPFEKPRYKSSLLAEYPVNLPDPFDFTHEVFPDGYFNKKRVESGHIPKRPDKPIDLDQAWTYYHNEFYKKAVDSFENLPTRQSASLDAKNGLAWSYLGTGEIQKSEEEFKEILSLYPRFIGALKGMEAVEEAKLNKAQYVSYYFGLEKYRIAKNKAELLKDEFPKWSHAYYQEGLIGVKTEKYGWAWNNFTEGLELSPDNPSILQGLEALLAESAPVLFEAETARKQGDLIQAAQKYWEYLDFHGMPEPTNEYFSQAYLGLGLTHYAQRQFDPAIWSFNKVVEQKGFRFKAAEGMGFCFYEKENFKMAAKYLSAADKMKPLQNEIQSKLDWSVLRSVPESEAIAHFKQALEKNPIRASAYLGLGWIHYKNGNPDLGVEYFLKSISLDPDFPQSQQFKSMLEQERYGWQVYNHLGWAYYFKKDYKKALNMFEVSLEENPKGSEVHKGVGYTLFNLKKHKHTIAFLKQALNLNASPEPVSIWAEDEKSITPFPLKTSARTVLARSYLALNQPQKALVEFNHELEAHPQWTEVHDGLGWTYLQLNRPTEARSEFHKALQLQPLNYSSIKGLNQIKRGKVDSQIVPARKKTVRLLKSKKHKMITTKSTKKAVSH